MSAEKKDKKKEGITIAEMKNWEQRVVIKKSIIHSANIYTSKNICILLFQITEMEAPHNWNAAWGEFFAKGVPIEYGERIKYLEEEMKKYPKPEISIPAGNIFTFNQHIVLL